MKDVVESVIIVVGVAIALGIGIITGWCFKSPEVKTTVITEYVVTTWWYSGNTLYWAFDHKYEPENFLQFQLDHKMPPTVNQEPIKKIFVFKDEVLVMAGNMTWRVHTKGSFENWYVEDYKEIE